MSNIQKTDIIKQVASNTGNSIKDCEVIINSFLNSIQSNLKNNDKISFIGFGAFNAKNIPESKGRNPATGKEITIAARRRVSFSVGKGFKDKVN